MTAKLNSSGKLSMHGTCRMNNAWTAVDWRFRDGALSGLPAD
jgi:hypothetical protein